MESKEIIKALECCLNTPVNCDNCAYTKYPVRDCNKILIKDITDLINRQQQEIERLKAEKDNLIKTYAECQIDLLRGFADKLKAFSFYTLNDLEVVDIDYIDNLVKEMVGADNESND